MILRFLHKLFPHHIPTITDWVWEVAVKGNTKLEEESMTAKYIGLALEYIEKEGE